jgi:tRNA G18 (ribose-2'-O)-methylase SpoU
MPKTAEAKLITALNSLDHPALLPYAQLTRTNRTRECDWFVAEGRWVVERLLASHYEVISVVVGEQVSTSFVDSIPSRIRVYRLPRDLVSQLVGFQFHSGIIACGQRVRKTSLQEIDEVLQATPATVVVCPNTVLPDNLGSIIRACTALGAGALLVGPLSADPFSRRAIRVSMGNIFQLPVVEAPSSETMIGLLRELGEVWGFHVLAATGRPGDPPLPIPRPAARIGLVLGNEAHGIPDDLLALCQQSVTIPMSGSTDSLNVAQAVAVLLYQFSCLPPARPAVAHDPATTMDHPDNFRT